MINDTKRRIEEAKALLPGIKERIIAVGLMLAMSVAMVASSSYAWLTISRSPEAKGMSTTITGNGNLEISLVPSDGSLPGNADGSATDLLSTNITWGNLVNLSDQRYGLDQIALRPALLSQYNLTTAPLYGATYGADGRVSGTSEKYSFASFTTAEDGTYYFAATTPSSPSYGVRAITSITYENISGNAALNALDAKITNAYGAAVQAYKALIGTKNAYASDNDSLIIYGEGATAVRAMPALQAMLELFVQEKAQNVLGSAEYDYSGHVTYMYYLIKAFQDILTLEGEALTSLANMQIYKSDNALGTGHYASFEEFAAAYNENELHSAVKLDSLKTFFSNYKSISNVLKNDPDKTDDLYDLAMACDPATVPAADRPKVLWSELSSYVAVLAKIDTVEIHHGNDVIKMNSIGGSSISPLMNIANKATKSSPATAVICGGALKDTEARIGAWLKESAVVLCIDVDYLSVGEVYAYATTDVDPQALTLSGKDQETVANMTNAGAESQGDAVANDTYGMAIDLWVRTNVSDVVLTLEGSLKTTEVIATTVNKDGVETTLYNMNLSVTTSGTAYGLTSEAGVTTYYSYEDDVLTEIGTAGTMLTMLGYKFTSNNTTREIDGVTYDEYAMTHTQSTNTDVYVVENVERWYREDGVFIGAADTLSSDARYHFEETAETKTVDGQTVKLYTITYTESADAEPVTGKGYKIAEDVWYQSVNHEAVGTDAQLRDEGATFTEKTETWVVGYDGVNRIWEDYLKMIDQGLMLENNTTQGSGSCYVFYADPSEQTRILHLLEAFTVVFMDQDGNKLGIAKLDTEHYYSINGKTTVPLKLTSGATFTDEEGNQQYGITAMNKNEATWVSAVIYLDGTRLTNSDVLAVGEIEGTLNIQFGSSIPLHNQDDNALRFEFRDLSATASIDGVTSDSSSRPISLDYDENGHEVTVTLKVEGTQPKSIQGFFIRSISKTQGTKGKTEPFTFQGNGVWTATFNLTTPGKYIMRSLIVDGAEYTLDDGTENAENGVVVDSFPTVEIDGLGIASVRVEGLNKGITMTADSSVSAEVTVGINADASLMPKQVRALFRGQNGEEFTAILSYAGDSGTGPTLWKGTANITESGEYTLQYVVMDGVFFDLTEIWESQGAQDPTQGQFTYIIYLGLTTQVWTTSETEFEYQGPTDISFQVKIFDGTGSEVRALDDVWLYYHSEGSILDQDGMYGQIKWNPDTGFYEGVLQLVAGGNFVFDRVVTNRNNQNSISTIGRADFSPTITAIVTDPPQYISNITDTDQFVPDGGATMKVELSNAQTADVWALIKDVTTGNIYMVKSGQYKTVGTNQQFPFTIPSIDRTADDENNPTQDGNWKLIALYMQGCADNNENWVSKTDNPLAEASWAELTDTNGDGTWEIGANGNTVNPSDFFVFDLTDASVKTCVVQTVYVSVNGGTSVPSTDIKFGNLAYGIEDANGNGKLDDGEEKTGTFMQEHKTDAVTFVITDWNGNPIELPTTITWTSTYSGDSQDNGGYWTEALTESTTVTLVPVDGKYTLPAQSYRLAGKHTTSFTISFTVGTDEAGKDITKDIPIDGATVNVYSKTPTVTITDITLDGNGAYSVDLNTSGSLADTSTYKTQSGGCITDYIYTCTTHKDHIFAANNKDYLSRIEDSGRTAWLYFKCNHSDVATYDGGTKNGNVGANFQGHTYDYANGEGVPKATITLSGMGEASEAELTFKAENGGEVIMITQYTPKSSGYKGDLTTYGTSSFEWTADGTCSRFIGVMENGAGSNGSDTKTAAGTIVATTLILTYDGVQYKVTVNITIHNPF